MAVPGFTFTPSTSSPAPSFSEVDSAVGSTASPDDPTKSNSQCSSTSDREENFECYGEGDEVDMDGDTGVLSRETNTVENSDNFGRRNTWLRKSVRRSPTPNKRLSSHALASQLYRSASFNSSGRSSNYDGDDMYSDVSLEDDVLDLNHKVELLQHQVTALAENQNNTDDRYNRSKQDNALLKQQLHALEEQVRETEQRAEERLEEEQRRHRDIIARVEREAQLQLENGSIRLQAAEKDCQRATEEAAKLRAEVDRLREERDTLLIQLSDTETAVSDMAQEVQRLSDQLKREKETYENESKTSMQLLNDLTQEVESLRSSQELVQNATMRSISPPDGYGRLQELEREVKQLREDNKNLRECSEELQAQLLNHGLEEGRHLVQGCVGNSLAAEFEAMTHDEVKIALKEQQEVNGQLREYIDGILLTIVENHPQLLEVKRTKQ